MNCLFKYYWHRKLKGSPFQTLFTHNDSNEYVSIDCETTSLEPTRAELVTIAATKIIDNRILTSDPFHVKLKAPKSLDEHSIKVHQIRHQDLGDGLDEKEALLQLLDFIGNRTIVGYHIRYDKKILDRAFKKHFGFPLPNSIIEVSTIYQQKLEKHLQNAYFDLSLEAICRHLDLPIRDHHNALQDAITAALVFVRLTKGDLPSLSMPHIK
ncbi:DNA polymerase III subunit epsilon [Vibrio sp. UCD-FRSSP16_10]|uniref:3'-5' exonuclease n=1 Tax=unclassified Vibrio TaxID=2614977 RepID=UPI000801037B|nr:MULTISPECIES: 3'-5' exonuclease [unclassified Vibrio]OBT16443.1 DNA polymerase III subunit epsilon [Vibrio sp. UCD-FRSSP16_30]OBT21308.1 DNA polymerase III subunit epsilon [Vibrio sp. UCD-FRSSP16_10]